MATIWVDAHDLLDLLVCPERHRGRAAGEPGGSSELGRFKPVRDESQPDRIIASHGDCNVALSARQATPTEPTRSGWWTTRMIVVDMHSMARFAKRLLAQIAATLLRGPHG